MRYGHYQQNGWDVIYKSAYNEDGSLFFPERLTEKFLEEAKLHQGTQKFTNQYLNQAIGGEDRPFKKEWLKYFTQLPENVHKYIMIDPAISQKDSADYTAISVVAVDYLKNWYVLSAQRYRMTPPEIINKLFELTIQFNPLAIGIEIVAFQEALMYMAREEMERRNIIIPLTGIKTSNQKTKETKILGLVPRFEWGHIFVYPGQIDFENEYLDYAGERSRHDDILDTLASIEEIIHYPTEPKKEIQYVPPTHPDYERWYIQQLASGKRPSRKEDDGIY